jgi:nucleolar protein 56
VEDENMIELNTNVLGTFALKNGRIIKEIPFPRDPRKVAEKLLKIENDLCDEELQLLSYLRETGVRSVKVRDPRRFSVYKLEIEFIEDKKPSNPLGIASDLGISEDEFTELLSRSNLEVTKIKLKDVDRDQIVIQAVASLDDLEESINRLIKRLREWYSLSFPELDLLVKKHELYAEIVNSDRRDLDPGLLEKINNAREKTLGIEFSEADRSAVEALSGSILGLYRTRERIESYIGGIMEDIAPSMSALAGPVLGARLIALAGGLNRLSILPASTIQVLGAEDAFFRFLKTGKRPPKHGVIFQLPEIRSASKNLRGKISRTFAAKLVIAAKVDRFKGEFIGDKLREDFLRKMEKLK